MGNTETQKKEIINDLEWRYATKKFDLDKKITDSDLDGLLESLRLSPSSFGLQPWKFIVVSNKELRAELKTHAWNQSQITDASHLIVLCAKKDIHEKDIDEYINEISIVRGISLADLAGFKEVLIGYRKNATNEFISNWTKRQVYIAFGFLMATAARKNIDSCPMEGFDNEKFDKLLGLNNSGYCSVAVCALGYRAGDDSYADLKKVRFGKERVFDFIE